MSKFAEMLESLREARGISKKDLAARAGLTAGYVSHLTRGEREAPSQSTITALAKALTLDEKITSQLFEAAGHSPYTPAVVVENSSILQDSEDTSQNIGSLDWGGAPNVKGFFGRSMELASLETWLLAEHCQTVLVTGMGGNGKTMLATKVTEQVQPKFRYVFWRSLQNAPSLESVLRDCLQFFSTQHRVKVADDVDTQMELLVKYLRDYRCLIVLDNIESVLEPKNQTGQYREGYEGYGRLFKLLGEVKHQSCLLLTGREKPKEIARLEGKNLPVRTMYLPGFNFLEGREILKEHELSGEDEAWDGLIHLYSGNPLALKLVSGFIREVFGGDIGGFLKEGEHFFSDIYDLLDQQFDRLTEAEQKIMYWLAIEREAVSLDDIFSDLAPPILKRELLDALDSLRRRSMIEVATTALYSLQPVILEYVTNRFIDQAYKEIVGLSEVNWLGSHALMKAQIRDYLRNAQVQLILRPLVNILLLALGYNGSERKLKDLLSVLHSAPPQTITYAAGNVINLLIQLHVDLRGYDFSHLVIRQVYLQRVSLLEVNFAFADFEEVVFNDTFGSIFSVALSPDDTWLAAGTDNGEVRLWEAASGKPFFTFEGHTDWVRSVAFSPDGKLLASGSDDQDVRIWDIDTRKCIKHLPGHEGWVFSVAFSPDGRLLASGSGDQRVYLWDVATGTRSGVLQKHTSGVTSVAFSSDGKLLASGSDDQSIRLWNLDTGACVKVLSGHESWVYTVAFSPDGKLLASGSADQSIRLWNVDTGQEVKILYKSSGWVYAVKFSPDGKLLASSNHENIQLWDTHTWQELKTFHGHTNRVYSISFSSDGKKLASGSTDQSVRLWDVDKQQALITLQGYINWVHSVAFSPDGKILAGGNADQSVQLWNINTHKLLKTLQGHINWVWSVAFSPDGQTLASSSDDQSIRLWDVKTGQVLMVLTDHANRVYSVAFSPDGHLLASGSADQTVRLWDVFSGECVTILRGHTDIIRSVAFSPDGKLLASAGQDQTVRLWDMKTRQTLREFNDHTDWIYSVAFSPDGKLLASAGQDQTVRLWDVSTGKCVTILDGHTNWVWSVAFHPDGKLLASGSQDRDVLLWDVSTGKCVHVLRGHADWVYSVVFSPDGASLASGSHEGTIKLWDVQTGRATYTLRSERPYEHMNIAGARGLTETQKSMLKMLGAVEK